MPVEKVQHKSHIKKVMFLAVVGRPRRDTVNNRNFDGKIGIFPFTRRAPAQRNSRNRAAGTMVTHMVEVTKAVYKEKMLVEVFPAIKAAWPGAPGDVFVQQDNAPSHNIVDDPDIVAAGTADGWNIRLINQPPNSPDTNILDLGFFNSIQSLQDRTTLNTVDELIDEVGRVFAAQDVAVLGRVWTTYQAVLEQIMLAKGDNKKRGWYPGIPWPPRVFFSTSPPPIMHDNEFFSCLRPRIALFRLFLKVAYIICIPNVAYIFCRTG